MAYYFRFPTINQLTIPQQAALNETEQIALSGGPGTGKSVVSLYRHLTNHNNGDKSLLLTFTKTLTKYLAGCCRLQNQNAAKYVRRACSGYPKSYERFSEVIVDEAQDLDANYYDRICQFKVSYGADDSQILYPEHSSTEANLKERYPDNVDYILDKNFRSTLAIMKFAKVAFPNALITQNTLDALKNNPGEKPTLIVTNGNPTFNSNAKEIRDNAIQEIINNNRGETYNIAILLPLKKNVEKYHELLDEMGIDHSRYYDDDSKFPNGCPDIDNVHITTFKSAKGLEFDTVIIPDFGSMDYLISRFDVLEWKDFYVAVTRARTNLYLFSNNTLPQLINVVE